MRQYKPFLQDFLRKSIYNFRIQHQFTQEKMAELLGVSSRSYIEQEHGKYGFSALSLIFYLLVLPEKDVLLLLEKIREDLQKIQQCSDKE